MNTNALKKFAQKARNLLLEDVSKRFLYWGFDKKGNILHNVEATGGGYLFRGAAHDDTSIPPKWNSLVSAVDRHSVQDIIEEATYTWFNRLMAIKILEQNGYDQPVLAYAAADLHEPVILRNAKRGIYPSSNPQEIQTLKRRLAGANDDEALAALLVSYCRNHQLLNRIFGHLDDYTELLIPGALLAKGGILELLNDESIIPDEDYREVELIGWLYQFYISDKKDDVFAGFKKKKKARAEDIPAATQIFTPKWIVKYLVENTVGRLWLDLHPESAVRETMKYLVEPKDSTKDEPIINDVTELKVLDPAVGSGHFLVVAFDLLMQMYQEEGYSKRMAVASIIENNLYGLDICPRAVGLANFAVLLKAAQSYPDILGERHFPRIFAMPESFDFSRNQLGAVFGTESDEYLDEIHLSLKLLKQGQNIGSALKLNLSEGARDLLSHTVSETDGFKRDLESQMTLNRLIPFARVALLLTNKYSAVVANPPYMGKKNMNGELVDYLKIHYPRSKSDLFAVFMEILPNLTSRKGTFGIINLPSWLFLSAFEEIRNIYISEHFIMNLLHFGRGVFGIDWGSVALTARNAKSNGKTGDYFKLHERTFQHIRNEDIEKLFHYSYQNPNYKYEFGQYRDENGINEIPQKGTENGQQLYFPNISQTKFLNIPGSPIAYWVSDQVMKVFETADNLDIHGSLREGIHTGKNEIFLKLWFEIEWSKFSNMEDSESSINKNQAKWLPYNKGGPYRKWYGNNDVVIRYDSSSRHEMSLLKSHVRPSQSLYFKEGGTWSAISSGSLGVRYYPSGHLFDSKGQVIVCSKYLINKISYMNSKVAKIFFNILMPTLDFKCGSVKNTPYLPIIDNNMLINNLSQNNIYIAKSDWNSHETSWGFSTSPLANNKSLKNAYNFWVEEVNKNFFDLFANEEELNKIFIEIFDLESELTPNVRLKDITLLQDELDRKEISNREEELKLNKTDLPIKTDVVIKQFLSYAIGCLMGRYRLDKIGLHIAHNNPSPEKRSSYNINGYNFDIDDDAIIPMMGAESPFSDDIIQRVQQFVLMVWGEDSYTENLNFINEALGEDLEKFLTKKFWDFHKKMYKKRPIYWQFASPKGAFKVLVYMHRMNRFTVQKIRQNYLFKQINYLESEITRLVANEASLNSTEARKLDHFRSNLLECRDYDLLLKDVADRQIEFDLDDGVVENYKLFEGVVSKI